MWEKVSNLLRRTRPNLLLWFEMVAVMFLLGHSAFYLNTAMDWDELDAATRMIDPHSGAEDAAHPYKNSDMINPFLNTRNHSVANLASKISLRTWGRSAWAARLPALIFTALFLVVLLGLLHEFASPFVRLLVLLHLAVNHLSLWYMHSMRGYISMMASTLFCLWWAWRWQRGKLNRGSQKVIFAFALMVPVFTHSFGGFFVGFLFLAAVVWLGGNSKILTSHEFRLRRSFLFSGAFALPVVAAVLGAQALFLNRVGLFHSPVSVDYLSIIPSLFGVMGHGTSHLFLVAVILFVVFSRPWSRNFRKDFLGLFVLGSALLFVFLIAVLKSQLFESRFLLGFLVPAVLWIGLKIDEINRPGLKNGLRALALIFLVGLPAYDGSRVDQYVTAMMGDYFSFVNQVQHRLVTRRVCFDFAGDEDQVRFSKVLYFSDRMTSGRCPEHYVLDFAQSWRGISPAAPGIHQTYQTIFTDGKNRFLYRVISQ